MRLIAHCDSCIELIKVSSFAPTRPDLVSEKGETLSLECTKCRNISQKHVNDIQAKDSLVLIGIGMLISIIITIVLWKFLGAIGTISIIIPPYIWQAQSKSISTFNNYRLKR